MDASKLTLFNLLALDSLSILKKFSSVRVATDTFQNTNQQIANMDAWQMHQIYFIDSKLL